MTWATISTRQMVLKNRINCLETQLIRISQDIQSTYDESSYDQQFAQMDYGEALAEAQDKYQNSMDELYKEHTKNIEGGKNASYDETKKYNDATKEYLTAKRGLDKKLEAKNRCNQDRTDAKTRALEAQQEQIETQLEAARAEYDQLDKACSQDIQKGAIKLVASN